MSHPLFYRVSPFDCAFDDVPHYYPQSPQLQTSAVEQTQPQWNSSQRPRSVQGARKQALSPVASVHSTKTAPSLRLTDVMTYYQSSSSPTYNDGSIGIHDGSSMPGPNYLSGAFSPSRQDDSWNPFNLRSTDNSGVRVPSYQSDIDLSLPVPHIETCGLPSDESYYSLEMNCLGRSNGPEFAGQDFSTSVLKQIGHRNVDNVLSGGTSMSHMPSDQLSRVSSTRSRRSTNQPIKCDYHGCNEISKCKSEYKKHMLKHEKRHKCEVLDCKRDGKGFSTINDLDRHKKSVHGVDLDKKSYKCAAERCKSRGKVWPRLDNFKQHVKRMHSDEDELDFIKRSIWHPEKHTSDMKDQSTVAPMDTNVALAELGKSFATSSSVCSSMPSFDVPSERHDQRWLSSEQDQHSWGSAPQPSQFLNVPISTRQDALVQRQRRGQRQAPELSRHTHDSLATDVESGAAPEENMPRAPQAKKDSGLSNAPQTKAEQQRLALQKLSKAASTSSNEVNLEELILDILHQATGSATWDSQSKRKGRQGSESPSDSSSITLTKSDALAASQMISKLIKQSPRSAQAAPRQASKGFIINPRVCKHDGCEYTVARDCDMRKHLKRHERPYGCTFPKCHKRFGAKSDWKRHENSQHFQLEAFRCAHELSLGQICGVHLHGQQAFENHLESHGFSSKDWGEVMKRSKIGKNRQGSFWCGFCNLVTQLRTRRNAAWDERFDHIAHHLEKEKRSIDEWVCAEENKTKKELRREMDSYAYEDEDADEKEKGDDLDASGEEDDEVRLPRPVAPETWTLTSVYPPLPPAQFDDAFLQLSCEKRSASAEFDDGDKVNKPKMRKTETIKYCCVCNNGPMSSIQVTCADCEHHLCRVCRTEQHVPNCMDFSP